jgi:uncharacterized membrane protein
MKPFLQNILKKRTIIAIGFFVVACLVIEFSNISLNLTPTSKVFVRNNIPIGPIIKGKVFVQEIKLQKDYISAIDILVATWARTNDNLNRILIYDTAQNLISSKTFSSEKLTDNSYLRVNMNKSVFIGKGNKLLLYVYSPDGNTKNNITIWSDTTSTWGKLYISELLEDNFNGKLESNLQSLKGSMIVKTYETNYNIEKKILCLCILFLSFFIAFSKNINQIIIRLNIRPERFYIITSLFYGLLFVFLTPPIQVPDEGIHFFRAYQISDFDFFQLKQTIPKSISEVSILSGLVFSNNTQNISFDSLTLIKLNPKHRIKTWSYWYIIPYIPQGIGIFIGRIFGLPPLFLLYLGRIFNLIFTTILIYSAIKIMPIFKWEFALISLMPMTLTQLASNSYDATAIGLAFLLISYILNLKFSSSGIISTNKIVLLFILSMLLAMCRPVYVLLIFLYLLLPPSKIGTIRKYFLIFFSLGFLVILAPFAIPFIRSLITVSNPLIEIPWRDPYIQIEFILDDPLNFVKVLWTTFFITHGTFYLDSFVGILGWLDNPLPKLIINSFLIVIFINALINRPKDLILNNMDRIIIIMIFFISILAIEIAIYLTWSPPGNPFVMGVQGRYFIPIAPLFFLVFYNTYISNKIITFVQYLKIKSYSLVIYDLVLKKDLANSKKLSYNYGLLLLCMFINFTLIATAIVIYSKYYYV